MTTKQQILQNLANGMTLEEAVEAAAPGADPKLWKRAIHWQPGNQQKSATRLERGHVGKMRRGVPDRVLYKRNALKEA